MGDSAVRFSILGAVASGVLLAEMWDQKRKRAENNGKNGLCSRTEALKLQGM